MATNHLGTLEAPKVHPVVAATARELLNKSENERSGVLSTAVSFLGLYRDPTIGRNTETCDWRIADLVAAANPVTLYLVVPPSDISRTKPLIRLILNQIGRRLTETLNANGERKQRQLLMILDEFPALGRLDTPLRWSGALVLGLAVVRALVVPQPDVLISSDGRSVAVRGRDGHLHLMQTGKDVFLIKEWLAADADARVPGDPTLASGVSCDDQGCVAALADGALVTHANSAEALSDDCERATLIISARQAPRDCAAAVIDRNRLRRQGALTLRRRADDFDVEAVKPRGFDRPWAPASGEEAGDAALHPRYDLTTPRRERQSAPKDKRPASLRDQGPPPIETCFRAYRGPGRRDRWGPAIRIALLPRGRGPAVGIDVELARCRGRGDGVVGVAELLAGRGVRLAGVVGLGGGCDLRGRCRDQQRCHSG